MTGEKRVIEQIDIDDTDIDGYQVEDVKKQKKSITTESQDRLDAINILQEGDKAVIDKALGEYLGKYVNDGEIWTKYIEWMINNPDKYEKKDIEGSFFKVLPKIYYIKLWILYVEYVEQNNPITPDDAERARSMVLKAYKFAIDTVGIDYFESGELWTRYLTYLKEWQAINPNEEKTKEDLISKALRSMISCPSQNFKDNWLSFTNFETSKDLNKSRKIISDVSNELANTRKMNEELEKITKSIQKLNDRNYSLRQLQKWNRWIEWEKKNPLQLEDGENVKKRILYAFNLSIQYARFMPQVWLNYSRYLISIDKKNEGVNTLKDGLRVNPGSFMLTNTLSNIYENEGDAKIEEIKKIWTDLIDYIIEKKIGNTASVVSVCYCELMKVMNRIIGLKEVRAVFKRARQFKEIEWIVYYEYSMIEFNRGEVNISNRSFSLGFQNYKSKIEFVMRYLEFLIRNKDMVTFKNIVEKCIDEFKEKNDLKSLKQIFNKYYEIESKFGDIKLVDNLCKRYDEIFGELKHLSFISNESLELMSVDVIGELDEYNNGSKSREITPADKDDVVERDAQLEDITKSLEISATEAATIKTPTASTTEALKSLLVALGNDPKTSNVDLQKATIMDLISLSGAGSPPPL